MIRKFNHILSKLALLGGILCIIGANNSYAQAPVANFTGSPLGGCTPLIVNFQDLSTGNPTSWNWDLGNGNSSALQNPTASYFTQGSYTVVLTVTNANGSNSLTRTQYVTVYQPPTVNFLGTPLAGCFPLRVQFTDLSTPGPGNTNVSWLWDFGNGITSTLQNPLAVYNSAGSFTVTLRVTNDKGCLSNFSRPAYVQATNGVKALFTNTQPTVCNAPASISFTNTSTGPPILSYFWDFGDFTTSTATNPVHSYASNGTYIATLVTTSTAGCMDTFYSNPIVIGSITSFNSPPGICVNGTATFTNTSNPAPTSSFWKFGDGGTANTINTTHTYGAPGTYTVTLYNTYPFCVDSVSRTLLVTLGPVPDFFAPVTSRCEPPLTVNFQDLSTGGATSWLWDFGDGSTSNLQNPSHTYTSYGSFDVKLRTANVYGCPDSITKANYIKINRAVITLPQLPVKGCIPFTITFVPVITALDIVTSYDWDFGDGGTSNLPNPTYTYVAQGTYDVRLIITTSTGCTDTLIVPAAVKVGTKPNADFVGDPLTVCGTQPVSFTDLTTPAADEWLWDFGDGTSNLQNPSHRYSDTGYFTVRLIAFNNGCPDTMIKPLYVHVLPPIARFTPVPNCDDRHQFSFTDRSIAPLTWNWDFGDGSTSTLQNPVHNYPALASYTVTLIVTNGACADTTTGLIRTIDENPDFSADNAVACKIATINFTATNVDTLNLTKYAWDFGDGSTDTLLVYSVSHTYNLAGTYTIKLVTTDLNGCTDSIIKINYIRINGPISDFTATNPSGCFGLTTTFNDLSTTDGVNPIVNWRWNFGDGVIQNYSGPPYQHTYNIPGTYAVQLIITDASGCKDSLTIPNIVNATDPVPDFASADTLSCPGASVTFTNLSTPTGFNSQWDFGDGGTSLATSPTHVYATPGLYTVKLRIQDFFGCPDSITKTNYIRVDLPSADFFADDTASFCAPFQVQFTNTSTFYKSVLWNFGPGEGTSTLDNPTHIYNAIGTYPVKLVVTSPGGCLDSIIRNMKVYDTLGSKIDYLPIRGCRPLTANFTVTTTGPIATVFWDFGDGNTLITTSSIVSHTYTSYGSYVPKAVLQDPAGCVMLLQGNDTFYVSGAKTKFGNDNYLFCDSGMVNFLDSTTFNDPIVNYNWSFGDGGTSTLQNPSHQFTAPGIYTVQLDVQTQLGCRDTTIKPKLIKVVQSPLIDIGGDSVVCVNSSLLHSGIFLRPDTSIVNWQWNFPNGSTSVLQNPPQQVYGAVGNFNITTIATNSTGCKDTTTQNLLVNPLPVVNMPAQMTVQNGFPVTIPATYSPNTTNWIWSPSSGLSCPSCPRPEAGPAFDTRYLVHFTDANGCVNNGAILVVTICKNFNLFIPNTFSPNGDGSNDIFYPRGRGLNRVKLLRIFNRWGEVVFENRNFPANDPSSGWNGTYNAKKPLAGVYVYQAEVYCENGDIIRLDGNIALIL